MRRTALGSTVALVLVLVAGTVVQPRGAIASSGTADQAVAYQINVAHTGNLSGDVLGPPLVQQWSRSDLGGTVSYPLIAGGKVFVTVAGPYGNSGSSPPKWIYALDENTGATIWSQPIPGTYQVVNAAYDNGTLFVLNYDGLLQSFDAGTGTPGWSVKLPGQYAFTSPPTASNGVVYAVGEGSGGTVYAVSESNGALNWSVSGLDTGGHSAPALSSSNVYVSGSCDVYGFYQNPPSGSSRMIWDKNYGCSGGGGKTPVLSANGLYVRQVGVPSSNDILDPGTGGVTARFTSGPAPAFSGTNGFFLSSGTLRAIDSNGNVLWSFAGDGGLDTAPIVVNTTVYVGSSSGTLYALDATTGQAAWSTNVGSGITGPDEQNATLTTGLAAGEGHLLVPAGSTLSAFVDGDTTPPVITPSVSGPQGSNGWYTGPTTVSWNVSDPESGVASSSGCGSTTLSANTTGTTLTCSATNGVGLTSSSSVTVKLDGSPPSITLTAPSATTYTLNQTVTASYSCADGGSGVASCAGSVASGQPISTASVGSKTFSVSAADVAGNQANPASVVYAVTYGVCQSSVPTIKSGHSGSISVQLCDARNSNVSAASVVLTAAGIYTSSGTLVRSLSNTFSFSGPFRNAGAGYVENVDTTGLATGTYYVAFTATGDPVRHQAAFTVR